MLAPVFGRHGMRPASVSDETDSAELEASEILWRDHLDGRADIVQVAG